MLRGSEESQDRVLTTIGTAVLVCVLLAVTAAVVNPFGGRQPKQMGVAIDTPYVGQGVEPGTAVVLHGVEVGKVTNVAPSAGGGVRLFTNLQKRPLAGLTDTMNIDFRPINYFGVPGVNIIPGHGGQALRDGSEIRVLPTGNFTLSELLSQLADVSAAAVTPKLITVVDRVSRYTDAFNPLFETMLLVTTAVADVQRVPTAQLLANTAEIGVALPPFFNVLAKGVARYADFSYYPEYGDPTGQLPTVPAPMSPAASPKRLIKPYLEYVYVRNSSEESEEYVQNAEKRFFEIASGGLFAAVGRLLTSHVDDLLPLINGIKPITDTARPLLRPGDIAQTLAELRSRFERLYAGNGEQRALQVRILLDSLPAVAAPLGVQGAPPGLEGSSPGDAVPPEVQGSPHGAEMPAETGGNP